MDPARGRTIRGCLLILGLVAAVAACSASGGAPVTPGSASAPSPTATGDGSTSSTPAPTPSPTPGPLDAFRAALSERDWQAEATSTGTIGDGLATIGGTYAARGDDATLTLETTTESSTTVAEQVLVGPASYLRANKTGAWRQDLPEAGRERAPSLRSALLDASFSPASTGYEATGPGAGAILEALGLVDPGAAPSDARVIASVTPDGALTRLEAAFDSAFGPWSVVYAFAPSPSVARITAPDDVVLLFQQPGVYLLLYPTHFEEMSVGQDGDIYDIYTSADAEAQVIVFCRPGDWNRKAWVKDGRTYYTKSWKAKPTATDTVTIGDVKWALTEWKKATFADRQVHAMNAAAVHGKMACDVQWLGPVGGGKDSQEAFGRILQTFTFLNE